jgi:hypothetical protein
MGSGEFPNNILHICFTFIFLQIVEPFLGFLLSVCSAHYCCACNTELLKTKLRGVMCIHERSVKKIFKCTDENRLDHKEQVRM